MKLKYISWLPAVIIMAIIFYFSSKPAIISGESSLMISQTLLNAYEDITDLSYEELARQQVLLGLDHIVRKTAHFIEYAILAATWVMHFITWKKGFRIAVGLSILITSVYAATDEFHQIFVAGRSGQISDVLLDSCGAVVGAFLFLSLNLIRKKLWNKHIEAKMPQ
jgi:VanZ family protein